MAKSRDAFRTISEVAEWLDTPAHVLRFWESKFTQVKPVKRAGGRRYYRPGDMELLGGIKRLLHDDGMTIKGVQKILREQGVRHVAALSAQRVEDETETDDAQLIEDAPFVDVEPDLAAEEPVDFAAAVRARGGADAVAPEEAEEPEAREVADHEAPVETAPVEEEWAGGDVVEPEPEEIAAVPQDAVVAPAPDEDEALWPEDDAGHERVADTDENDHWPSDEGAPERHPEAADQMEGDLPEAATQPDDADRDESGAGTDSDLVEAAAEDWLPEQDEDSSEFSGIDADEREMAAHHPDAETGHPEPEEAFAQPANMVDPDDLPEPEPGPLFLLAATRRIGPELAPAIATQSAALAALHERLSAPIRR